MSNPQIAILAGLAVVVCYGWLMWAFEPFREFNLRIGRFFFGILPEKMQVVFTIPELRRKIFFTLGLLAIYRVGWQIPLPVINPAETGQTQSGLFGFLQQVSMFSASNLSKLTIFGLGIMPYISASIILQLLASVWAPLEKLQKEGETGRKKINEYTRYLTVVICLFQSAFYLGFMKGTFNPHFTQGEIAGNSLTFHWQVLCVLIMTCGTIFLMWLGEQIDEFGIGNGISLLIMAGILANMPGVMWEKVLQPIFSGGVSIGGNMGIETLLVLMVLFVAVVFCVVFITQGQRRIPTQSAKHVRGRRVFGGTRQHLPLRVNQSGVMPIIFASSLLLIPGMIFGQLAKSFPGRWLGELGWLDLSNMFNRGTSFVYNALYVLLIFFFCYFWTAITFNPKEMANNLQDFGSFIPGYRPGKRTADYLEKVMLRITYVGAGFLALVAILPTIIYAVMKIDMNLASFYGGTSLLIAVSVAFDLCQKIDSHLVMRNYKGILEG